MTSPKSKPAGPSFPHRRHPAPLLQAFEAPPAEGALLAQQAGTSEARAKLLREFSSWTKTPPNVSQSPAAWTLLEAWDRVWMRLIDDKATWTAPELLQAQTQLELLLELLLQEKVITLADYQCSRYAADSYVECWLDGLMERSGVRQLNFSIHMSPRRGEADVGHGIRVQYQ